MQCSWSWLLYTDIILHLSKTLGKLLLLCISLCSWFPGVLRKLTHPSLHQKKEKSRFFVRLGFFPHIPTFLPSLCLSFHGLRVILGSSQSVEYFPLPSSSCLFAYLFGLVFRTFLTEIECPFKVHSSDSFKYGNFSFSYGNFSFSSISTDIKISISPYVLLLSESLPKHK